MAKQSTVLLRTGMFMVLVLLLSATASCIGSGTPPPESIKTKDARVIDIPFYPQEKYQCGPAAMASVLNYRGLSITPEEIAREIYSESARGTLNIDMVFFAESKGMKAIQYSGSMADLKKNIDGLNPVIVLVDYGFLNYRKDHFMVVVGYDNSSVIAHSGKNSFLPVPNEEFLKVWKRTNNWALLVQKTGSDTK